MNVERFQRYRQLPRTPADASSRRYYANYNRDFETGQSNCDRLSNAFRKRQLWETILAGWGKNGTLIPRRTQAAKRRKE
jgi:hypothetical protein